jgi:endonuclease YncB( thermonuclease family)
MQVARRGPLCVLGLVLALATPARSADGTKAKQAISVLVFGKDVTFQTHGRGKYGRTIDDVLLLDGTDTTYKLTTCRMVPIC